MTNIGKTAADIMNLVLASSVITEATCAGLIRKSAKKKTELILEAVRDCRVEPDQRFKMKEASAHVDYLDKSILRVEAELFLRIQPYCHLVRHLSESLPGVSELSAALILAETGADMSVFGSAKHFASWAGLAPAYNESSGKKKSVRVSKAGQF
jgi:transposase